MSQTLQMFLQRIFLGPRSSFRNGHRPWLYSGFIALIILLIGMSGARHY